MQLTNTSYTGEYGVNHLSAGSNPARVNGSTLPDDERGCA